MSILKDSFFTTFGKAYKNVLALGFTMILSRMFNETEYGTYRQAMLICNFLNLFFLLGFPEVVSYYYQIVNPQKRNWLISNTLVFKLGSAVFVFVALLLSGNVVSRMMNNPDLGRFMFWVALLSASFIFNSILEQYYIAAGKAVLMSKYQVVLFTAYYVGAAVVIFWSKDMLFLLYSMALVEFVRSIIMFWHIFKLEQFQFSINLPFFKEMIKFAAPLGASALLITLNRDVDKLMISFFYSPDQYAVFNNAAMNLPIVELITISVGSVIFPRLSKINAESSFKDAVKVFAKTADFTAMVLYPLFCLFSFFPEGYIAFLFSEKYMAAVPIFQIYLFRMVITIALYTSLMILVNKKKLVMMISFVSVISNIVLNLLLINLLGMAGAAVATVIVELLIVSLTIGFSMKYGHVKLTEVVHLKELLVVMAIPVAMGLLMKGVSSLLSLGHILNFFGYGSILVAGSYVIYYLIGLVDKEYVMSLLKKKTKQA